MDNTSNEQQGSAQLKKRSAIPHQSGMLHLYRKYHWLKWLIVVLIIIVVLMMIRSCGSKKGKEDHHPTVMVVPGKAQSMDVPVYLSALGTVTPVDSITVITQIDGLLMDVFFKEGQMVKKGDLLAQIDQRPLLAQLNQYQGQLQRDTALLANARIDLKRYETLFKEDSVSQQTLETQRWLVKQYEGDVKTDQGLIESVKVNLIYSRITSPVNGRVGLRLVDPGNFVQTTNTTGLFVLNTLQPITVIFILPEDDIPQVMKQVNAGKTLIAEAYDRSQTHHLANGNLYAVDNQIDTTTGTVKLRAQFKNEDNMLFPNQFVNIKLLVDKLHNACVVPTAAILHGSKGAFVFLLASNNTVKMTPVTIGIVYGDNTVIKAGVKPGDTLIVEGTDKLNDGVKVKIWQNGSGSKKA